MAYLYDVIWIGLLLCVIECIYLRVKKKYYTFLENFWMKIKWKKKGHYIDVKFENPYNNYNLRKITYHQYLSIFVGFSDLMEAQLDRLRYEVFQNLFYSPMDAGILRAAVATAPTVYGIETQLLQCHVL